MLCLLQIRGAPNRIYCQLRGEWPVLLLVSRGSFQNTVTLSNDTVPSACSNSDEALTVISEPNKRRGTLG